MLKKIEKRFNNRGSSKKFKHKCRNKYNNKKYSRFVKYNNDFIDDLNISKIHWECSRIYVKCVDCDKKIFISKTPQQIEEEHVYCKRCDGSGFYKDKYNKILSCCYDYICNKCKYCSYCKLNKDILYSCSYYCCCERNICNDCQVYSHCISKYCEESLCATHNNKHFVYLLIDIFPSEIVNIINKYANSKCTYVNHIKNCKLNYVIT